MVTPYGGGGRPLPSRPRPAAVLVKPVGAACNSRCIYCFYHPGQRADAVVRMSEDMLRQLLRQVARLPVPRPGICWQGGEPTLAGLDFYRHALALQQEIATKPLAHSLQTNGLLLDADWAAFLAAENFLVGLSLDGPENLHDANRRMASGAPTWRRVMDAAHRLQDAGVRVNALCCLSSQAAAAIEEVYTFFADEGFDHVQFLPLLETVAPDTPAMAPYALTAESYGDALCRLWDLWLARLEEGKGPGVRLFESFCLKALGHPPTLCEMYACCGAYAVVEADGSMYPCDFFVADQWKLGTLHDGLPEVLSSPKSLHFNELRLLLRPECLHCQWLPFCNGGCLKHRQLGGHLLPKTFFCEAYQRFFAHAHKQVARVDACLMRHGHTPFFANSSEVTP